MGVSFVWQGMSQGSWVVLVPSEIGRERFKAVDQAKLRQVL